MAWFESPGPDPPRELTLDELRRLVRQGFEQRALQLWAGTCPACGCNRASLTPQPCHETQDVLELRLVLAAEPPTPRRRATPRKPGPGVRRPLPQSQKRVDGAVVVRFVDPAELRKAAA